MLGILCVSKLLENNQRMMIHLYYLTFSFMRVLVHMTRETAAHLNSHFASFNPTHHNAQNTVVI